jgi:hypothetical protein
MRGGAMPVDYTRRLYPGVRAGGLYPGTIPPLVNPICYPAGVSLLREHAFFLLGGGRPPRPARKVLTWSGQSDLWEESDLGANHCFIRDVLEQCPSAWIDREEWDANFPGLSGVWHTVSTSNPDALKQEIEDSVARKLTFWGHPRVW